MEIRKKGNGRMIIGLLLITAALSLTGYNVWDERRAGNASEEILEQLSAELDEDAPVETEIAEPDAGEMEIPDYVLNPDMEMPTKEIDGRDYIGVLEIPALSLSLPVMSDWSYPKLKISPCRYSGSVYLDNLVIAGHSYQTHFGPMRNLTPGIDVWFTDMDGNVFEYIVEATEVLKPIEVEKMTDSGWDLTLFTCTFDRRSRFALRCTRVTEEM